MDISVDVTLFLQPGTLDEDRALDYVDHLQRYMPGAALGVKLAIGPPAPYHSVPFLDRLDVVGQAPGVVSALTAARDALAATLHCAPDDLPIITVVVNVLSGSDDPLAIELDAA